MKFTQNNLEETSKQFHNILFNQDIGDVGRKFLSQRGLGELSDFSQYEIGYCPPEYPYPSSQSLWADNRLWWMRGRLIVTVRDQHGRIISFAGRVIEDNKDILYKDLLNKKDTLLLSHLKGDESKIQDMVDDWSSRKWVNEIYPKKEYLFGLNFAKKHIFDMNYAVIVEGYMDAFALWMNGFPNTVALCGVAMSETHYALLRRYAGHIVYCLDADKGGQKGMELAEAVHKNNDMNTDTTYYKIYLPKHGEKGLDPEDTIKDEKHKNIFLNAIRKASDRKDINLKKKYLDLSDDATRQILK